MKRLFALLSALALLEGSAFATQADRPTTQAGANGVKPFKISKRVVSVQPHFKNVAKPASAVESGDAGPARPSAMRTRHSAVGSSQ